MSYQSLECQYIPKGIVADIPEFKQFVRDELAILMRGKKEFEADGKGEVPLPMGVYIFYKDGTMTKTLIMPANDFEKKVMILAAKKQIKAPVVVGGVVHCTEPIYGALIAEVFMASYEMTDEEKEQDPDEVSEKYTKKFRKSEEDGMSGKVTRIILQFEDAVTGEYQCELSSIIDPCILVDDQESSERMSEALNANRGPSVHNVLQSLFDYSEEQELNALGSMNKTLNFYDLNEAVKFIQDLLKNG